MHQLKVIQHFPFAILWQSFGCPMAVHWLSQFATKTPVFPSIWLFQMDRNTLHPVFTALIMAITRALIHPS